MYIQQLVHVMLKIIINYLNKLKLNTATCWFLLYGYFN